MAREPLGLLQGTVDVLILKTLSWSAMHGYGIAQWIGQRSGGDLALEDAALYQALHRLERKGLIASAWGLSENNRRAKFYRLTPPGRRALRSEAASWERYVALVARVLAAAQQPA